MLKLLLPSEFNRSCNGTISSRMYRRHVSSSIIVSSMVGWNFQASVSLQASYAVYIHLTKKEKNLTKSQEVQKQRKQWNIKIKTIMSTVKGNRVDWLILLVTLLFSFSFLIKKYIKETVDTTDVQCKYSVALFKPDTSVISWKVHTPPLGTDVGPKPVAYWVLNFYSVGAHGEIITDTS